MLKVFGLLTTLVLSTCASVAPAQNGSACAPHEVIQLRLNTAYSETRNAIALSTSGSVVEFWRNNLTGTWTVTVTQPGRMTCIVASGIEWHKVEEELSVQGDPT